MVQQDLMQQDFFSGWLQALSWDTSQRKMLSLLSFLWSLFFSLTIQFVPYWNKISENNHEKTIVGCCGFPFFVCSSPSFASSVADHSSYGWKTFEKTLLFIFIVWGSLAFYLPTAFAKIVCIISGSFCKQIPNTGGSIEDSARGGNSSCTGKVQYLNTSRSWPKSPDLGNHNLNMSQNHMHTAVCCVSLGRGRVDFPGPRYWAS